MVHCTLHVVDDVECGTLADGVGGGTLADGVGGGTLADGVGGGTLADGITCMAGGTLGASGDTVCVTLGCSAVVGTLACADVCLFFRW